MTEPKVLVVNCGSSSLKLARVEPGSGRMLEHGLAERLGSAEACFTLHLPNGTERVAAPKASHAAALAGMLERLGTDGIVAIGHRVVHGGEAFRESVPIDDHTLATIDSSSDLAPLHNPANVIGIREARRRFPNLLQVAVFDTAFHQSMPARAYMYAIPYELYERHRIRRYGFHGTSHRYVAALAAERLGKPLEALELVTAHLGNGCSVCAVSGGKSVDTSMGFTPLEGLVMGTRSGDVDPNLHGYLGEHVGLSLDAVTELLNEKSGLLGLSGVSNDMRNLLELEAQGHRRAILAVDVFCYRLAKGILGMCAGLGRLDALVFTGGIGEHAARVRAQTLAHLSLLGLQVDDESNEQHGRKTGGRITLAASPVPGFVVSTNEELVIAREALRLLELAGEG